MATQSPDLLRPVLKDLRRAGIKARVSKRDGAVLVLPGTGPDGYLALRLLYPALRRIRVQTKLN